MKSIAEIGNIELAGLGGDFRRAQERALQLAAKSPKSDERCTSCRDTGWLHPDADNPLRGVKKCRVTECVARRKAALEAKRSQAEVAMDEGDEDI
jgi:hypothetical protein